MIFANHTGIRITEEEGYHFTGADKKWRMLMVGRTALVQKALAAGTPTAQIDHDEIDTHVRLIIDRHKSLRHL
jgi:hypothetical protein